MKNFQFGPDRNFFAVEIIHAATLDESDGDFPLAFADLNITDFITSTPRIAYVESDHLGIGGFFIAPAQTVETVMESIIDCYSNASPDAISEFIIPLDADKMVFMHISIGDFFKPK
jgi:hypothetical protein